MISCRRPCCGERGSQKSSSGAPWSQAQNQWKTLEILAFLAAGAWRDRYRTVPPTKGRWESYGFPKTLEILAKSMVSQLPPLTRGSHVPGGPPRSTWGSCQEINENHCKTLCFRSLCQGRIPLRRRGQKKKPFPCFYDYFWETLSLGDLYDVRNVT